MAKNIILLMVSVITACALTSCSFTDEYDDLQDAAATAAPMNVNFTVSTRAGDDAVAANENDIKDYNTEDPSYRIYFFDNTDGTDGHKYVMSFTPETVTPENSGSQALYSVSGKLDDASIEKINALDGGFTVVFIANWKEYPLDEDMEGATINQLCTGDIGEGFDATFECPTADTDNGYSGIYIPFYGVKKITSLASVTTSDNEVNLGDINLLRAMAKITVVNVTKTKTRTTYYPDIYDVKLVHYNSTGYCAPTDVYSEDDYVTDDDEEVEDKTYYVESLHLVDDANDSPQSESTTIDMYPVPKTNDSIWIAYVPEYENKTSDYKCHIEFSVKCDGDVDGDDEYTYKYTSDYNPGTISFADYNTEDGTIVSGSDYDVKRNRSYRFNVSLPKVFKLTLGTGDDDPEAEEWHVKKK
ncbi:MAG: hypothetical protein LUD48_04235 [Prevotella sp.]|nr:hypothetical protein [Prevotella sp.]